MHNFCTFSGFVAQCNYARDNRGLCSYETPLQHSKMDSSYQLIDHRLHI